MPELAAHADSIYRDVVRAIWAGNWSRLEDNYRTRCSALGVPDWYLDEVLFQAMMLWSQGRLYDVQRSLAAVLERLPGVEVFDAHAAREVAQAVAA